MPIEYLNFDSYNATKLNNEAFNATFTILCKYRNVKKISLKNLELQTLEIHYFARTISRIHELAQ